MRPRCGKWRREPRKRGGARAHTHTHTRLNASCADTLLIWLGTVSPAPDGKSGKRDDADDDDDNDDDDAAQGWLDFTLLC